ncbi:M20/M25/M40 family metallo-hydrolase [Sporosarcina thermotolerans]|uniref:M20/M25/M40 family metallo-hydrolase n=2 Tax=Sporosarcina thermotolerans TaxID=633404 RepID=A0AAW9A6I3_9BACL|nr:M20/M25/M40 family metallo-hydrolase [Sporosarcina thermotolerans]MDW0116579.1 M20/M25/M40 family metallo-hydrolase [Sporosarcina thermotolerans]WHT49852.1 M20/M25/M40 family metallo-hydrolase [Sporosarcina thermotolerans]
MKWNTPESLEDLLCEVVGWDSRTGTEGEIEFATRILKKILEMHYFQENSSHIHFHDAGKGRNAVTAYYDSGVTNKTIVLISHFDTVHIEEFGGLEELAFNPSALTEELKKRITDLPEDVQADLKSNDYLFGRGTMDMKMGLVLHLHLLEKASIEKWPINLLLLTVPDEEVNSSGMRASVKGLLELRAEYGLQYELFLNGEPSFSQKPQDTNYYIYSGSIGKIMPSALFYGRETHAGEPLSGITGHYMASYLTKAMEFNPHFVEEEYGEKTPLPVCLQEIDLKEDYSVQTSHHTAALYNVFLMRQNADDIMTIFKHTAVNAMAECTNDYKAICEREGVTPIGDIRVLEYTELLEYAIKKLGATEVEGIIKNAEADDSFDERKMSMQITDDLMRICQELAPATILFYAPPYYPAVNSSNNELVRDKIALTKRVLKEEFNVNATQVHYFNGISDLSYVNYDSADTGWQSFKNNTPVWGDTYSIPFTEMQQLQSPVMNIGPFGKDAHKLTERLHKESAFKYTPFVLTKVIESMFAEVKA